MLITQELRRYFSKVDWSHTDFTERRPQLAEWALHLLGDLPGPRVLDLGCGSAALAVELAERGLAVTGLDLWIDHARQRCAARGIQVELIEQDMRELDHVEAFDAVINWDVAGIGMLGETGDREVVRRVQRALVPGGKFLIQTYSAAYAERHGIEGLSWNPSTRQVCGNVRGRDLAVRLYSPAEWMGMLEDCGLYPRSLCSPQANRSVDDEMMLTLVAERRPPTARLSGPGSRE